MIATQRMNRHGHTRPVHTRAKQVFAKSQIADLDGGSNTETGFSSG
jgi:hypothetical protein